MTRRLCLWYACLCIWLLAVAPGCGEQVEGDVHVDNGSEELIVVFVDGKQEARIGPGRCRRLTLPLGDRTFKVTQGDHVIYEQTHKVDSGNRPFRRPTYVLNPDRKNRYCEVEVAHKDEDVQSQDLEDLITMISNSSKNATPNEDVVTEGQTDEAIQAAKEKRETNRAIIRQYREVLKNLIAMGDDAFFPVAHGSHLFRPLPMVGYNRHGGDQKRTTLARVPKVLHDYIAEAATVKKPTVAELDRLKLAHDVTLSYVAFR